DKHFIFELSHFMTFSQLLQLGSLYAKREAADPDQLKTIPLSPKPVTNLNDEYIVSYALYGYNFSANVKPIKLTPPPHTHTHIYTYTHTQQVF
ncbi:hypothetical protein LSH36_372g02013, partial [Paralvinella palmiformis]